MMKKLVILLSIFTVIVGLVACNQQQKEVKEKTNVTEQKDVNGTKKEAEKENNKQESKNENTTNQPVTNPPANTVYKNDIFKDVVVTNAGDEILVTGKAQVFEGNFQYALYNGEKVLIENNYQTKGAPAWGEFKITFKKELVTSNEIKLELFDYSAKDGSKVNTLEIPIPQP